MSPYIVNTFYTDKTTFSIGYGVRAFEHKVKSLSGIGKFIENLTVCLVEFKEKAISIMGEYAVKILILVKIKPSDTFEFNIGLTEQFIEGDFNPQHEMAPKRQITFGISSQICFPIMITSIKKFETLI